MAMEFEEATKLLGNMSCEYAAQLGRFAPSLTDEILDAVLLAHVLSQTLVLMSEEYGNKIMRTWTRAGGLRDHLRAVYAKYRVN